MSFSELLPSGPGTPALATPAQCTCTSAIVATLAETLDCPYAWYEQPDGTWAHTPGWKRAHRGATTKQRTRP